MAGRILLGKKRQVLAGNRQSHGSPVVKLSSSKGRRGFTAKMVQAKVALSLLPPQVGIWGPEVLQNQTDEQIITHACVVVSNG